MNRAILLLALVVFQLELLAEEANKPFSFVALGDTAYTEDRYAEYETLIQTINESDTAFSIHVGDTIGYQPCNEASDQTVSKFFGQFRMPLIYTPGDNEWRDCFFASDEVDDKSNADDYTFRLERLTTLRRLYFSEPESLGQTKMRVTRQSDVSDFSNMVENSYWIHNEVLFATVHLVGSANGMSAWSEATSLESIKRNHANEAWINTVAKIAVEQDVKAVVFAMHAGLFDEGKDYGELSTLIGTRIREGIFSAYGRVAFSLLPFFDNFERPVLIIHGDYHQFIVDRPFLAYNSEKDPDENPHKHVTRLQVFGAPELKAVRVTVEPDTPWVFGFTPLY